MWSALAARYASSSSRLAERAGSGNAEGFQSAGAALENEGVAFVFGVPGEGHLDVLESLRTSSINPAPSGSLGLPRWRLTSDGAMGRRIHWPALPPLTTVQLRSAYKGPKVRCCLWAPLP